jgi:polygalacturonase
MVMRGDLKAGAVLPGCRGDGLSDDGEAFQRALDGGSKGIYVPEGRYLMGRPLKIRGGTKLSLHPRAYVVLADGVARSTDDYLLSNADPENGDGDITISGGIWDGNNRGNARPAGLFDQGCSGALFHFRNVRDLRLQDLHFRNAEAYHVRLTHVRGFHIEGIRFSADRVRPNNDGIHLGVTARTG